jgi:aryl-alcohol dehydrogenase-like predicted oxidoreductase
MSQPPAARNSIPRRRPDRTIEEVPILGLETGPSGIRLGDAAAIPICERAIDPGVDHIDTSPVYGRAQVQLGNVMRRRREQVLLATKIRVAPAPEAPRAFEQSLRARRTEQVDLACVHAIGRADLGQAMGPGRALS